MEEKSKDLILPLAEFFELVHSFGIFFSGIFTMEVCSVFLAAFHVFDF